MSQPGRNWDDWRDAAANLALRARHLFASGHLSDCSFEIDSRQVCCHKLILAMGSPVFQAMFFGEMATSEACPIKILDIEYDVFQQLLTYLYCDELVITSAKNACDVYNAAKKYIVTPLVKECLNYLHHNLEVSNVIPVYEFSRFHGEGNLEKHCIKEIQLNTGKILVSGSFIEANVQTVSAILDFACLNIDSEVELVAAVRKWSDAERIRRGSLKDDNMAETISSLVKKLRLLTLTADEFIESLADSSILTEKEKFYVLSRIVRPDLLLYPGDIPNVCDKKSKRRPCRSQCFIRLQLEDISSSRCDGSEWLTSTFTTNSRITLLGIELSLQTSISGGEYQENIMVKLGEANSSEHFAGGSHYGLVQYNGKIAVMFSSKSVLEPYKEYSIHTFLCKPGMYPIGKNSNFTCIGPGNVEIEFLNHSSWERSHPWNTTVLTGLYYTDPLD